MANRTYELMFIVAPETAEDDINKLNDTITSLVEKEGGTIVKVENWGRRRMAYSINKKSDGYYVLFEIEGSGQEIAELERRMRVNDQIMRFMTVRVDEERKAADKIIAKREKKRSGRRGEQANASAADADAA